jgi:type IV pilus assembly protein PilC
MERIPKVYVLAKLRDQSMHCTEIKLTKSAKAGGGGFGRKKLKPKSIVVFSRQFATMIDAGIPILRCMGHPVQPVQRTP